MASLTIYLDTETLHQVEDAARREGTSISGWARKCLSEASKPRSEWPDGYFETIAAFGGTELVEVEESATPLDDIAID